MRKRTYLQRTVIRFRKWSRKGYAVFASLHRCVTIGRVGKGIADSSLSKGKQELLVCHAANYEERVGRKEWDDLPDDGGGGLLSLYAGLLPVLAHTDKEVCPDSCAFSFCLDVKLFPNRDELSFVGSSFLFGNSSFFDKKVMRYENR